MRRPSIAGQPGALTPTPGRCSHLLCAVSRAVDPSVRGAQPYRHADGDEQVRPDASVETRIRAGAGIGGRPTLCC